MMIETGWSAEVEADKKNLRQMMRRKIGQSKGYTISLGADKDVYLVDNIRVVAGDFHISLKGSPEETKRARQNLEAELSIKLSSSYDDETASKSEILFPFLRK